MTGPDCAVVCDLIKTHIHTDTHTHGHAVGRLRRRQATWWKVRRKDRAQEHILR